MANLKSEEARNPGETRPETKSYKKGLRKSYDEANRLFSVSLGLREELVSPNMLGLTGGEGGQQARAEQTPSEKIGFTAFGTSL